MANDGQIVFQVEIDGKNAKVDIQEITRMIQKESDKWDKAAGQASDGIEAKFGGMLKKVAAGFSAVKIGQALLDIGKAAISAASDLEEVQNVVDVTFGENANKIEKWAKNAGSQFGLTETQAKKFSSTMGAMLKSSGLAGEQIVDVSTDLAGLAADMASFYNLDFDEAFSKIRSGISGQTMPLKELGIDMSVASLNAFALQKGLTKTFDQMSQGEQTMLRYQYLMTATADAQGDFARTSDGYANSMRKLETNLESLKTNLGKTLLPVITEVTGALNDMLEKMLPDESKRTVLDDFADIDLNTESKIADIKHTAEEARLLTEELDKIGGEKASKAGGKVQQLVNDLSNINLDQGKAGVVKDFISTLGENIDIISSIQGTSAEGAQEWLNGIAQAADSLDPEDAKGWTDLINSIKEGLPGIENTEFGSSFFAALGGGMSNVESKASLFSWAIENLGDKTDKTAEEQKVWLETCKRLVQTIPGLSSIINTETGEVQGGTQAVKDYIKAWEDGQVKLAMLGALKQKESAVAERFADLPGLQLDAALAERRVRKQKEKMDELRKKYGFTQDYGEMIIQKVNPDDTIVPFTEAEKEWNSAVGELAKLKKAADDASDAYTNQKEALDEAEVALKEYGETIDEYPGEIEDVADATDHWLESTGKTVEELQELTNAAAEASKELADYYESVRASVEGAVNSTVKGFEQIKSPMMQAEEKTKDITDKLTKLGSRTKDNASEWDKLNDELNTYNGQQVTSQGMAANLKQQAQWMDTYLENLRHAREMGVSDDVLAELSDGSAESYDYLAALAKASPEEVKQINEGFERVKEKKKELTDELTGQKLTVDQTYQTLADKAKEAVAALDLEGEAATNSGKTVAGIAQGISSHVSEVQEAVDAVLKELNRLSAYGISVNLGTFGSLNTSSDTGRHHQRRGGNVEGAFAGGATWIPHDDFIARLHEGERVLTAQENARYTALMNGGVSGFDLETLGGVMRDNVKAGGNVFLDGKVVGNVISDRQGRSYKSLQRSGWQS